MKLIKRSKTHKERQAVFSLSYFNANSLACADLYDENVNSENIPEFV